MADKNSVDDWDGASAIGNDNVGGIPTGETVMLVSQVNNALREMMKQIKAHFGKFLRVDTATAFNDTQKAQGRTNLGIPTSTTSTAAPSGGANGDVWYQVV